MSDFLSPETPQEMRPEDPHADTEAAPVDGQLAYLPIAVYFVAYTGQMQVRLGTNGPFLFNAFRADGQVVDYPVIKACSIVCPDGTIAEANLVNPSTPADETLPVVASAGQPGVMLPIYVLYKLTLPGVYKIRIELAWGAVLASTPQEVTITCSL